MTLPTKYGTAQRPSGIKRMGHLVGLKIIARAVKARVELAQSDDILMPEKVQIRLGRTTRMNNRKFKNSKRQPNSL